MCRMTPVSQISPQKDKRETENRKLTIPAGGASESLLLERVGRTREGQVPSDALACLKEHRKHGEINGLWCRKHAIEAYLNKNRISPQHCQSHY